MTTKMKRVMQWLFDYSLNFYFIYLFSYLLSFSYFFLLIAILIFLSVMTYNQTKCGIIYEKIAMRAGDDERMINYEWPNNCWIFLKKIIEKYDFLVLFKPITKFAIKWDSWKKEG